MYGERTELRTAPEFVASAMDRLGVLESPTLGFEETVHWGRGRCLGGVLKHLSANILALLGPRHITVNWT